MRRKILSIALIVVLIFSFGTTIFGGGLGDNEPMATGTSAPINIHICDCEDVCSFNVSS